MAFHRILTTIPTFEELELPPRLGGFCGLSRGLIAVTGFLGSGKTTTLAAMINHINQNANKHIVQIESPIEFIHDSGRSIVHQREVGFHVRSYATGVREACRIGADVIVVSEVRDAETLNAILDATEKGVLVFTTVHASSVAAGLAEMQSYYAAEDYPRIQARLATSLRVMMAQTLLNRVEGGMKVPLQEIMVNCSSARRYIQAGDFHPLGGAMVHSRGLGSQTVDMGLRDLLSSGLINEEEALFHAVDRESVLAAAPTV